MGCVRNPECRGRRDFFYDDQSSDVRENRRKTSRVSASGRDQEPAVTTATPENDAEGDYEMFSTMGDEELDRQIRLQRLLAKKERRKEQSDL